MSGSDGCADTFLNKIACNEAESQDLRRSDSGRRVFRRFYSKSEAGGISNPSMCIINTEPTHNKHGAAHVYYAHRRILCYN